MITLKQIYLVAFLLLSSLGFSEAFVQVIHNSADPAAASVDVYVNGVKPDALDDFETLIINRGKESGIVVMSLDEYNSLNATAHEMSSKANMKRLTDSINQIESGEYQERELIEP